MDSLDEFKVLTIREFASLKNLPEPTVRSRIRLGKYATVPMDVEGKQVHGIRVKMSELNSDDQHDHPDNHPLPLNNQSLSMSSSKTISLDYQQMINSRDEEIKSLREQLERERLQYRSQIDELRAQLSSEQVKYAEIKGDLKRIDTVEELVNTQKETINAQKIANDALNNERIVITQQLQKYRSQDDGDPKPKAKKGGFLWFGK